MNRDGMKYLVAGSLLTVFFGWVFKNIDAKPALASDAQDVSAEPGKKDPKTRDKTIVATQLKLIDHRGKVAAILGTYSNGAPFLRMLGDNKKSYLEVESEGFTIVDNGIDAFRVVVRDGDRRIYVRYDKNRPAYTLDADDEGTCAVSLWGKAGNSIGFSCEQDGSAVTSLRGKGREGGITLAVDPNGVPFAYLTNAAKRGSLSLSCYENAPGITVTYPDDKGQAIIGSCGDGKTDPPGVMFRVLDDERNQLWGAP